MPLLGINPTEYTGTTHNYDRHLDLPKQQNVNTNNCFAAQDNENTQLTAKRQQTIQTQAREHLKGNVSFHEALEFSER